ncbi:hypothetical protein AX16_010267 [Volvariella volvacea WC 439]|nr:hypothetical protein AX16_010267 [Volvariella volvacea WC 439]
MPSITSGKVLVTGANSYVSTWLIRALFDKGYTVRGVVRSEQKAKYLTDNLFKREFDEGKLEIVFVRDITKDGAFDEAAKGVDAIQHVASPSNLTTEDPELLIRPAVDGTLSILKTAYKDGSTVQRVVFIGSCAAVAEIRQEPATYSEEDWNNQSVEITNAQGKEALNAFKYCASKTLAEKAAWEFYEKHKGSTNRDIVFINPPYVCTPVLNEVNSVSELNQSMTEWYDHVILNKEPIYDGASWIDIRDVADIMVASMEVPAAGGERMIAATAPFTWQEWIETANAITPQPKLVTPVPKPDEERRKKSKYMMLYNTSKEERILGIKKRTMAETTRDILIDLSNRGW